jgi:ribosomal-protein-alanine N-acetyltransferase
MQLVLERCTIRPWRLDDAESLAAHANNRKVWLALRDLFPHPYTIEDARKFLEAAVNSEPITNFALKLMAQPSVGLDFGLERTCIGVPPNLATGSARSSGDAVS